MKDDSKNTSETLARYFGDHEEMDTLNINLAKLHASRSSRRGISKGIAISVDKFKKKQSDSK